MDSLSFTFLAFASYTVALLVSSPLYRRGVDLRILDTWEIRRSPRVWLMAALFMVMIDMVVDPLSVLGDRWFLGRIFWYDPPGPHFGVPISNYLGWYFVAAITIAIFQWLDAGSIAARPNPRACCPAMRVARAARSDALRGNRRASESRCCSVSTRRNRMGGVFIYLPFAVLAIHILTRARMLGRRRRGRAPSRGLSLRARSSCLEANERAEARVPPRNRLGTRLPKLRRLWQASITATTTHSR